jgi:hypothetical protein
MLALLFSPPATAVEFKKGEFEGDWNTTLTYGVQFRVEDRDEEIVGPPAGTAYSVNGDDGNLNYDRGLVSNAFSLTTEVELRWRNFGGFFRAFGLYDIENEQGDRARTPLTDGALERVGSRIELRDAFLWWKFSTERRPGEVRLGQQVLSWGESTFIQGGINTINPVDVSALRVPGAELRNALLPVGMVWATFSISQNVTAEGFYQYDFDRTIIDPPGTYFSSNDFVGMGGTHVFLGFGDSPDLGTYPGTSRPFLGVPRGADERPEDTGQYGVALRWFVPKLAGTEFGFYYIRYHSRLPTIDGQVGTLAGVQSAGGFGLAGGTALATLQGTGDRDQAISAGVTAGTNAGLSPVDATIVSTAAVDTQLAGGDGVAVTTAFATDAYAQTAHYRISYPEEIDLFGVSFNTQLGTSGWGLQGEWSHRRNAPLQADDVELLFAALAPINGVLAGKECSVSGTPCTLDSQCPAAESCVFDPGPGASQFASFREEDYSTQFETVIPGAERIDIDQIQSTATKVFSRIAGANTGLLLVEAAVTLADLPDKSDMRFEGAGTYVSGNPYHSDPGNILPAHAGKAAETPQRFADSTSWGYRLAGRLEYNNAVGAWNLLPRFSWQHDVSGVSPGPGGSFIDGRMAFSLGVTGTYQNTWSVDLGYTSYFGASRYNLINDRDFIAANAKFSF